MKQTKFANPKLQGIAIVAESRTMRDLLLSAFFEVIALAVLSFSIYFTYSMGFNLYTYKPQSYVPESSQREAYLLWPVLIFGWVLIVLVTPLRRRAKRYRTNAQGKLRKDGRDTVLYLRSFDDDYMEDKKTGEEILVSALEDIGPVVAVGKPGEKQNLLGATRIYLKDQHWQTSVRYLMSISQLVVAHANISQGLQWEIQNARGNLAPERLLISFLSWQEQDEFTRQRLYESFKRHAEKILRCSMPEKLGQASFLYFEPDWTCKLLEVSEGKKLLFGKIYFCSFKERSLLTFKLSDSSVREALRPILKERHLRIGIWKSLIEVIKFSLLFVGCLFLVLYDFVA
jgi:hypothetical protein